MYQKPKSKGTSTKKSARKVPIKPRRKKQGSWELLCNDREKALYKHLVNQSAGREETYQALTSLLVELSNVTGITWWDPRILKVFYRRACQVAHEADGSKRHDIFDVIGDIGNVLDLELPDATLEYVNQHAQFPRMTAKETIANLINRDPSKAGYRVSLTEEDDEPAPERTNSELETSRGKLDGLELLPENEAIRFQLETQIFKLERESANTDEWTDVIE
jgi:hypothetical protein